MADSPLLLTPNLAAHFLAGELGGSHATWKAKLANYRRPDRKAHIDVANDEGAYSHADLSRFVDEERARRAVVGSTGHSGTTQALAVAVTGVVEPHVRVTLRTGTTEFAASLAPTQALTFAKALSTALHALQEAAKADSAEQHTRVDSLMHTESESE